MLFPTFKTELEYLKRGFDFVAGCDEAGRGPVAGPVVAAACVLDPQGIGQKRSRNKWYARVRDSKTVNEAEREILAQKILSHTIAHGVGVVWQEEIDEINIHNASLKAMRLAVEDLFEKIEPVSKILIFIDGRFTIPNLRYDIEQKSVIDADALILSVSAASIVAKVHRDGIMKGLHAKFPEYGFVRHKGYNTREHQRAIRKFGPSAVHRKSFVNKG